MEDRSVSEEEEEEEGRIFDAQNLGREEKKREGKGQVGELEKGSEGRSVRRNWRSRLLSLLLYAGVQYLTNGSLRVEEMR